MLAIDIGVEWFNSPHKDYTLKVYSKQSVPIKDSNNVMNQLHTDGKSPTEFTASTFCGMTTGCSPNAVYGGPAAVTAIDPATTNLWWL